MNDYSRYPNLFMGCERVNITQDELSSKWKFIKALVGNTTPAAQVPNGFVSVNPYTGGYPTGYSLYLRNCGEYPVNHKHKYLLEGFTHFHQTGTGSIAHYYNYVLVTPRHIGDLNSEWEIREEKASPGVYNCVLDNHIEATVSTNNNTAYHNYKLAEEEGYVDIDYSFGGIINNYLHADICDMRVEGDEIYVTVENSHIKFYSYTKIPENCVDVSYYKNNLNHKVLRLHFNQHDINIKLSFSLDSLDDAKEKYERSKNDIDEVIKDSRTEWNKIFNLIDVKGDEEQKIIFYTSMYNSFKKPMHVKKNKFYDFATLWDQYKTHLPLVALLRPDLYKEMINSLINEKEKDDIFPIGVLMQTFRANFDVQAKCLAHPLISLAYILKIDGIDYNKACKYMYDDIMRNELFVTNQIEKRNTYTLDLAEASYHTSALAKEIGMTEIHEEMNELSKNWIDAYDKDTGLLHKDLPYYEGDYWTYSFRLMHDMDGRINLIGKDKLLNQLDSFFGFSDDNDEYRFQGLNNEPDMESMFYYHYLNSVNKTYEIIDSALHNQFNTSRGGFPGNEDSGGLSSWFVFNSIGLFPMSGYNKLFISRPIFDEVKLNLENEFKIVVENNSRENKYVKEIILNNVPLSRNYITFDEILKGGKLVLKMTSHK